MNMNKFTLTQIAKLVKSELILLVLGGLSLIVFTLAIFSFAKSKNPPAITSSQTPWQNNIYAGKTTKEELKSALGSPIDVKKEQGKETYLYPSTNENRLHEIEIAESTVDIIKEQIIGEEKGKLKDYIQNYGQYEAEFFGKHGTFAPGFFWGKNGILVFANKNDGIIIEIWYFTPTSIIDFLQKNPEIKKQEPQNF